MNFDDGFTLVKPGKKSRRNVNTKIHNVLQDIDIDETIERIQKAKEELHQSEFMQKFLSSSDILEEIKFIYCFGLGQLSSSIARYQTAFVLIIKEYLRFSEGRLEVYDPVFSNKEISVLIKLGFTVATVNNHCNVHIGEKSLVFLPHCPRELTNNLLYTNLKSASSTSSSSTSSSSTSSSTSSGTSSTSASSTSSSTSSATSTLPSAESSTKLISTTSSQPTESFLSTSSSTISNVILISNSISSILLRTPAREIETSAKILQLVSTAGLVKETSIENTFKFSDIFNDLSLHLFDDPSADLLQGISAPVYSSSSEFII